jgi:hypothetical protein
MKKEKSLKEAFEQLFLDAKKQRDIILKKNEIIKKKTEELEAISKKFHSGHSVVLLNQEMPEIKAQDYHRFYPERSYTIIGVSITASAFCCIDGLAGGVMIFFSLQLKEGDAWSCNWPDLKIECKKGANYYVVFSRDRYDNDKQFFEPGDEIAIFDFSQFELIEQAMIKTFNQLDWPLGGLNIKNRP